MGRMEQDPTEAMQDLAIAIHQTTNGHMVDRTVAERIEHYAEPFDVRLAKARVAFKAGEEAVVSYLMGKE